MRERAYAILSRIQKIANEKFGEVMKDEIDLSTQEFARLCSNDKRVSKEKRERLKKLIDSGKLVEKKSVTNDAMMREKERFIRTKIEQEIRAGNLDPDADN